MSDTTPATLPPEELEAIRQRHAKATPGEWKPLKTGRTGHSEHWTAVQTKRFAFDVIVPMVADEDEARAIAVFAAHAHADIPALLAHAAALTRELEAARASLRTAWEAGFALCRTYSDNWIHWQGEQKERTWQRFLGTLASPPPSPPPGTESKVAEKCSDGACAACGLFRSNEPLGRGDICSSCRRSGVRHATLAEDPHGGIVFPFAAPTPAAATPAPAGEGRVKQLEAAILDIDAHATPLGADADGFATTGYAISIGCLHRALGLVGHTSPKCEQPREQDISEPLGKRVQAVLCDDGTYSYIVDGVNTSAPARQDAAAEKGDHK